MFIKTFEKLLMASFTFKSRASAQSVAVWIRIWCRIFLWHELRGTRVKYYMEGVNREDRFESLIMHCVISEPCRFLAKWFMKKSSAIFRNKAMLQGLQPPIADLCWLRASPVTRVLQCLIMLRSGLALRLCLL